MTSFTIHNGADIVPARYFLRRRVSGAQWTPTTRARGVAALTILAELILSSGTYDVVSVATTKTDNVDVLKLSCTIRRPGDPAIIDQAHAKLEQLSNELNFTDSDDHVTINVHIWVSDYSGINNEESDQEEYADEPNYEA